MPLTLELLVLENLKESNFNMKKAIEDIVTTCNPGFLTIVAKVSKRCNIRPACEYCYDYCATSNSKKYDMNLETLENMIKTSVGDSHFYRVRFVWHGGEPLIVGRKFYESALEFQKKYNPGKTIVTNRIQTNAVALNDSWIDFFKANEFNMESSFDAFDNDITRGQTKKVFSNLLHARDRGMAPGNTMFICTKRNINRLREAYDFFEDIGLNFNPSPIIALGKACQSQELAITPEAYGNALADLMDYYLLEKKERKIKIRFLDAVMNAIITGEQKICSHGFCVYEYVSTDHKGDIYPCAKANEPEWCFGNVNKIKGFSEIFETLRYKAYAKECTERLEGCATERKGKPCEILQYCKGGCASNAISAGGYSKRDFYCQTYKIVFNHAIDILAEIQKRKTLGDSKKLAKNLKTSGGSD